MKPALTLEKQLELLEKRNLIIDVSRDFALNFLAENNYYRLSGYFKLFTKPDSDDFIDGFSFSSLMKLYIFDFDFRRVLNDLLEEVEIIVKTQIAYNLSLELGPVFYLDSQCFHDNARYKDFLDKVESERKNNKTSAIVIRYKGSDMPIWALVELLSFGTISKMYSNLKQEHQRKVVGADKYYQYNHNAFASYIYVVVQLRNRCAHRARIYARYIGANISMSLNDKLLFDKYSYPYDVSKSTCTAFMAIYAAFKLIKDKKSKQSYIDKIQSLFTQYNDVVNPNQLGFFDNWDEVLKG